MDASTFLRWWGFTTVDDDEVRRIAAGRPAWARDVGPAFVLDEFPPVRSLTDAATLELDFCRIDRAGNDAWWVRYGYPDFWEHDADGGVRVIGHHERLPEGPVRSTYFVRGGDFSQVIVLMLLAPLFVLAPLVFLPGWWRAGALLPVALLVNVRTELASVRSGIAAVHDRLATCSIPPVPPRLSPGAGWPRARRGADRWF